MNCNDVRTLLSAVADRNEMGQGNVDMDYLVNNGYIERISKDDYNAMAADLVTLGQLKGDIAILENTKNDAIMVQDEDVKQSHSFFFRFKSKETKDALDAKIQNEREIIVRATNDIQTKDAQVSQIIAKQSNLDRLVAYGDSYIAITNLGNTTLATLNVRISRVKDMSFEDFSEELKTTTNELEGIAGRAKYYVSQLEDNVKSTRVEYDSDSDEYNYDNSYDDARSVKDLSQLWGNSIGLAKIQGEPNEILARFRNALGSLDGINSTQESKMMAAEIMASSPSIDNVELLKQTDKELRENVHVPEELSIGIAAILMYGRKYDGTVPTERFTEFTKRTSSYEAAAVLASNEIDTNQLNQKFDAFRNMFDSWNYTKSEDSELASAYLAVSEFNPSDVETKFRIVLQSLTNYLEYPLVAGAILVSIPTLEANETLDLMEKACAILGDVASGLERSELIALAVRMIHGVQNETIKKLDSTATISRTPVQFTYQPRPMFFPMWWYIIVVHNSYYSTYSGIGGSHPSHAHGVGGFSG